MTKQQHTRTSPFIALLKERYSLTKEGSKKNASHLVIDISGSEMEYSPGDSAAVIASNDPAIIDKTLAALHASGEENITAKKSGETLTIGEYLTKHVTITRLTRSFVTLAAENTTDDTAKKKLSTLLLPDNKEAFQNLIDTYHFWDFLEEHPITLSLQDFCNTLLPLSPRLYSIASSKDAVGEEIHLAVALVKYNTNDHHRYGVCSHYLCELAQLNDRISLYIQKAHNFTVPENPNTDIIMVGPGTGVAPFRAFIQERIHTNAPGKNWLFYGDWTEENDFCYGEYWKELEASKKLRLDTAFSRDQDYKIYVQHKILENGADIWKWLQGGAHFYVCGDAKYMAKDVSAALHNIAMEHGNLSDEEASQYFIDMKKSGRYQQDIY
ncbi:MAG: sulfite reductase [Waddliaceae bacterium]|jgi:sulfite reductase (NADPH) flavoprotein alpha-component|nr:sulfite reductase [Waddliaceae bacterium]MBT3578888.1 sulfite reductase [Waddliaceae bacterium]MBT4445036.1 sulfite reductase [Waddliaceae bacterium]MBT6929044.1 sulfite reductase [Waddliaceae bacterium]MBT7264043.1 sulfite reductase [Waddliaceae bacterium]